MKFVFKMFILVFLFLLGTVETVKSDQPEVEMNSDISVGTETGKHMILMCKAKGFSTADIILNIKKNHCVLTKEDKVETSGVKPHDDGTFWRRKHILILKSDMSNYSCEVSHNASRFRVEKVWDNPEVEMNSQIVNVGTETGNHRILTCKAKGFNTTDITLNIKKNHYVLTKEDKVETSGVKQEEGIFWRRDHVIISKSDMSNYSCEVIHAASRFRVEKVWDPDSGGRGRIISSKFIDTYPPAVFTFTDDSKVQTNVILQCVATGFYPNNITVNIKRNGRILTREDGVKSSRVCSNEDDTFKRREYVEIKKSDMSDYTCEVIHAASGSRVEKVWDHRLPPDHTVIIIGVVVGGLLVLAGVLVFVFRKRILAWVNRCRTINTPAKTESKASLDRKNSFDSGSSDTGSIGSGSQISTSSVSDNGNGTNNAEAENLLEGNVYESEVSRNISS